MRRNGLLFVALALLAASAFSAEPEGTLVFEVRDYESDVPINKNVHKQLEHAGLPWGIEGEMLVISMVNQQYVKTRLSHLTRWGESEEVRLAPGEYRITCIGYEQREISRDPEEVLAESAYFNVDVLTFSIRSGEVTRLELLPRFHKTGKWIHVFVPEVQATLFEDGSEVQKAVITERTSESLRWDEYVGPLKF